MANSANPKEINDIVKVCKIGGPLYDSGYSVATNHPTNHQGTICQFTKENSLNNSGSADISLEDPNRNLIGKGGEKKRSEIRENDITIRLGTLNAMNCIKDIEENWKFLERFRRRYTSNESCPKGGHSNVDLNRYCDFLEFPSTSLERRMMGNMPKRVNDCKCERSAEILDDTLINAQEDAKISKNEESGRHNCKSTAGRSKQTQNNATLVTQQKSPSTTENTGKLKKAVKVNSQSCQSIYESEYNKLREELKFEYLPFLLTIFDKDGSIRYVENEGMSGESEQSDCELKSANVIANTTKPKRLHTPKKRTGATTFNKRAGNTNNALKIKKTSNNPVKVIKKNQAVVSQKILF